MALYSSKTIAKVCQTALRAVEARQRGNKWVSIGGHKFDLETGGYCCRYVRQVFEATLGLGEREWRFGSPSATETLTKLEECGFKLKPHVELRAGDIIGHKEGRFGHIGVVVGDAYGDGRFLYCENTIAHRGSPNEPGTKVTRVSDWPGPLLKYRLGPS
jgi:hypothetical protein